MFFGNSVNIDANPGGMYPLNNLAASPQACLMEVENSLYKPIIPPISKNDQFC